MIEKPVNKNQRINVNISVIRQISHLKQTLEIVHMITENKKHVV